MKLNRSLLINIILAFFAGSVIFLITNGSALNRLDFFSSDTLFKLRGKIKQEPPIVIVEITDADVAKIGRWPWKRSWHAAMAKVLSDLGAQAIYFDVIFSEPSSEKDDNLFEEAIKASGRVYLPYVFPERPYNMDTALLPIKRFSSQIKGMGAMNVYPDKDGTIRNLPLIFKTTDGTYPHIALKMVMDYNKLDIDEISDERIVLSNDEEKVIIPLINGDSVIVNWIGKWTDSFKHYSFIDLLAGYQDYLEGKNPEGIDISRFKNAICLVGITGFGLYDIKPVPLEPEYPGIGIIANTISTLINERFISIPPKWVNTAIIFLLALIPAFILFGDNPLKETLLVFLVSVIYFSIVFFLFLKGLRLSLFFPLLSLLSSYVIVGTYNFVRTTVEKQSLFSISITDGLTGLCNIRYFKMLLETEIKMARSGMSQGFVLILSDIDHFKHFNDTYGHQVGDLVLKEVSNTLKASVRATDIVGRYGGEEMIILLKNTSLSMGMDIAEKIRNNVESNKFSDDKNTYSVTASFGVASYLPDDTVDTIIKRTDEGLYKGKEEGRNCVKTIQEGDLSDYSVA